MDALTVFFSGMPYILVSDQPYRLRISDMGGFEEAASAVAGHTVPSSSQTVSPHASRTMPYG